MFLLGMVGLISKWIVLPLFYKKFSLAFRSLASGFEGA